MTDHDPFDGFPDDDPLLESDLASLGALLGDEAVWAEPTPGLEDAVVAAINHGIEAADGTGGAGPGDHAPAGGAPADGTDRAGGADVLPFRRQRRWVGPVLGAAAALVVVAAFSLWSRVADTELTPDYVVALAGTDLASEASAVADVTTTPLGTRIILDLTGVPPAPEGQYYEAWLRQSAEVGVSAGTFHLRGGDGVIELWAGVTIDDYPLVTVTVQDEGAGAMSSGRVVLRGTIDG